MRILTRLGVFAAALLVIDAVQAAQALNAPPAARGVVVVDTPQPARDRLADERARLRHGVVAEVGPNAEWVHVNGARMGIVAGRTTVYQRGKPVSASVLSKGQLLRFSLAADASNGTTLGVVYVP